MSFPHGHALLIGVGSYVHHEVVTNLPNTVEDVRQLAALLTNPQYCGYPAEQVTILHDAAATRAGVLRALDQLVDTTTAQSTVLIYYAGHGHYDGPADAAERTYFLTTHETDLTPEPPIAPATRGPTRWIVPDTAISQTELLAVLQRLPAQRVLLLFNACHAGELHPTMSLGAESPPAFQGSNPPDPLAAALLGTGSGRVIITACQDSQVSQAGPGPTTIFAEYLLAALRGEDVPNRTGTISVFDLYMAVYTKVKARTLDRYYRHQEPVLTIIRGVGPFPVALYRGATSLGLSDADAPPAEGDVVRMMSSQDSRQALATLLGRMDQKLDQLGRQLARMVPPAPLLDPLPAALATLASMPLDQLPIPAMNLPAAARMPFTRNPGFVGRERELLDLAAALANPAPTVMVSAVAAGLGGLGKTSLAIEFVYRYGRYFAGGVCWLNCADPTTIPSEVAACAGTLGLAVAGQSLDEQVAAVRRAWETAIPRLLVFDNCEDPQILDQWRPPHGGSRVLVTARRGNWPRHLYQVALDVLDRADSIALLTQLCPRVTPAEADGLAEDLGDLPLALHLAGSYLATYHHTTVAVYRAQLSLDHASLKGRGTDTLPTHHERDVARTFALSYTQLDPANAIDDLAGWLLACAACLAPGVPIPRDLLLAMVPEETPPEDATDALGRLRALGLLDGEVPVLHRLLAGFVQQHLHFRAAQDTVERVLTEQAYWINIAGWPTNMFLVLPHLQYVAAFVMDRADERSGALLMNLGYHLKALGHYEAARPFVERSLDINRIVLGQDHVVTVRVMNNLASLLDDMGKHDEARPLYEQAVAIREVVLGPDHPDTASSLNNLATLLDEIGEYTEARVLFERSLTVYEAAFGSMHPAVARTLSNFGRLLYNMHEYDGARVLHERALAILEKVHDPHHPDVGTSLNNLASALDALGDYVRALSLYERSLAITEQALGTSHPRTRMVRGNLAACRDALDQAATEE